MTGRTRPSEPLNTRLPAVTILTQYFYPEVAATAQLLTDLAIGLQQLGHRVRVLTGQPSYTGQGRQPGKQCHQGVLIRRFRNPGITRRSTLGRLLNTATVALPIFFRLLLSRRRGVLLVDSTSPFLPVVTLLIYWLRRWPFVYLIEDLYPDIAIQLGYMRPKGIVARFWVRIHRWLYGSASRFIVLGPRMRERVLAQVGATDRLDRARDVAVIHNWANGDLIKPIAKSENWFCEAHGLSEAMVILYSGNMGSSHDLESIVRAADRLRSLTDVKFVFIGGGAKRETIVALVAELGLDNVQVLPYQRREDLPYSLTCGDVSVVALEPGIEGLSVPSKLYSSLAAGQAVLAIMNEGSEVGDIIREEHCGFRVDPGDVDGVAGVIRRFHDDPQLLASARENSRACFDARFSRPQAIESYSRVLSEASTR